MTLYGGEILYYDYEPGHVTPTLITDMSGNGNHGSLTGATFGVGPVGSAIVSASANILLPGLVPGTSDFTWATWVRFAATGQVAVFGSGSVSWPGTGTLALYKHTTNVLSAYGDNGSINAGGGPQMDVGPWYHIAASRSAGVLTTYRNGVAISTDTTAGANLTGTLEIRTTGGTALDDTRVFNRGITAAEMRDMWASGAGRIGKTSPLINLINAQCGALATRAQWLPPACNVAGDGVLVDLARVGHGEGKNGATFSAASWAWGFPGLGGPTVRNYNGNSHYDDIGTMPGCLPAVNTGGISGSFLIRPDSITGNRTIWGGGDETRDIEMTMIAGTISLYLYTASHNIEIATNNAMFAVNESAVISYSLAPDGTGFISKNGVSVPVTITGVFPTDFIDLTQNICVGALGGAAKYGYFSGPMAMNEIRFGQTMTPAQSAEIYGALMKESGMSIRVDPNAHRAMVVA